MPTQLGDVECGEQLPAPLLYVSSSPDQRHCAVRGSRHRPGRGPVPRGISNSVSIRSRVTAFGIFHADGSGRARRPPSTRTVRPTHLRTRTARAPSSRFGSRAPVRRIRRWRRRKSRRRAASPLCQGLVVGLTVLIGWAFEGRLRTGRAWRRSWSPESLRSIHDPNKCPAWAGGPRLFWWLSPCPRSKSVTMAVE